jgi:3-oxoacyl-[acyl-carrier protein] reductase
LNTFSIQVIYLNFYFRQSNRQTDFNYLTAYLCHSNHPSNQLDMDLQLKGKIALVLAASKGLGKASAMALAMEGADIVIGARNRDILEGAAEEIRSISGAKVLAVSIDVNEPADAERIIAAAVAEYGGLDILVNNAGGPPFGKFESFTDASWQSAFELTLLSTVRFCRLAIPHLKKSGSGRIINITSLSTKTYLPDSVLSTSLRLGVSGMAKMLANELGPYNITVNNVAPGMILTDRIKETVLKNAPAGANPEELLAARTKDIPVGRIGRPEELGVLVAFLASPLAGYITGTTIQVDGGAIKAMAP